MRLLALPVAVSAVAVCLWACGSPAPVPRPKAYPRIQLYDSVYRSPDGMPLHFEVNAGCVATVDSMSPSGSLWLTVDYPLYGGRLYCTFSRVADGEAAFVIANRRQRVALNAGGAPTEVVAMRMPTGYDAEVSVTPSGSATPVQVVAAGRGYVVSGAFFLEAAVERPDSVRPIVEAVRADIVHLVKTLR